MNKSRSIKPNYSKQEIIQIIWQYGPSIPLLVNDKLNKKSGGVNNYAEDPEDYNAI